MNEWNNSRFEKMLEQPEEMVKERFRHTDTDHEAIGLMLRYDVDHAGKDQNATWPGFREAMALAKDESGGDRSAVTERREVKVILHKLMNGRIELPSLPDIFSRLMTLMNDPKSSAKDFEEIILKDTALTAKLLQLVNSAFFGYAYRSRIDSVSLAVSIVGVDGLFSLVLGMSVIRMFRDIPTRLIDMAAFWKHAISCGIVARLIAVHKRYREIERFFVGGLLHDIGRLLILQHLPCHAKWTLVESVLNREVLHVSENRLMGFDHAWIGSILMKKWQLPENLIDMVKFHHIPEEAANRPEAAIIHVAEILAGALSMGTSGELYVPPLCEKGWKALDMEAAALTGIMEKAETQVEQTVEIFL